MDPKGRKMCGILTIEDVKTRKEFSDFLFVKNQHIRKVGFITCRANLDKTSLLSFDMRRPSVTMAARGSERGIQIRNSPPGLPKI